MEEKLKRKDNSVISFNRADTTHGQLIRPKYYIMQGGEKE